MIKFIDEKETIGKYGKGLETPTLYTVFNRLDLVKKAFGQIKKVKPKKLYIAQDGPREHVEGDKEKVLAVRDYILSNIDWGCEIKTLFREKNLGLNNALIGAINWFFENEEQGIFVEEDIYMSLSGFHFLEKMLNKFKYDKDVWFVLAYNILNRTDITYDYAKTDFFISWGWAGWKDKWKKVSFKEVKNIDFIDNSFKNKRLANALKAFIKSVEPLLYDSQMNLETILNHAYTIIPKYPLSVHLGFGESTYDTTLLNESLHIYHPKIEDVKEIDIDQLEDYEKLSIVKTYESLVNISLKIINFPIADTKTEVNISNITSRYKKIAIYGAGMAGRQFYAAYEDMLSDKVCCFLDDDPKDVELMGKPILKPENIPDDVDLVIISPQSKKAYENMKEKVNSKKAIWLRDLLF
jgi:predicted CoA-binding protein